MSHETGVIRFAWIDEQMPEEDFTDEERMLMCYAVFRYRNGEGEEPSFDDRSLKTCWRNIKREIDANVSKYNETCDTNRRNGKKGGRPKTEKTERFSGKPIETEKNRKNRTVSGETQKNPEKPNETQDNPTKPNETLYDNDNDNESESESESESEFEYDNDNGAAVVVEVIKFAEKAFCRPLSQIESESLIDWLKTESAELVKYALETSALANVRNISYVNGILRNWHSNGIRTPAEAADQKPPGKGGKSTINRVFNTGRDECTDEEIFEVF